MALAHHNNADVGAFDINAPATRFIFYYVFAIATAYYYLLPIWAGMFVEQMGFSIKQLGFLLSADSLASNITTISALFWVHRVSWRKILLVCVGLFSVANLICAIADSFYSILLMRYLSGAAAGCMAAVVYSAFSTTENPDKHFSLSISLQVVMGMLFIGTAPITNTMPGSTFIIMGLLILLPILMNKRFPDHDPHLDTAKPHEESSNADSPAIRRNVNWTVIGLGFIGVFLFFAAANTVWPFMERIGNAEGFSATFISGILSVALVFSLLGALAPAWFSERINRRSAMLAGAAAMLISFLALADHPGMVLYVLGLFGYNFFYSFSIPFQGGLIANNDHTGRVIVLMPGIMGLGIAVGPVIASQFVSVDNFGAGVYAGACLLVMSAIFFLLAQYNEQRQ